jgi:hypothetical protein
MSVVSQSLSRRCAITRLGGPLAEASSLGERSMPSAISSRRTRQGQPRKGRTASITQTFLSQPGHRSSRGEPVVPDAQHAGPRRGERPLNKSIAGRIAQRAAHEAELGPRRRESVDQGDRCSVRQSGGVAEAEGPESSALPSSDVHRLDRSQGGLSKVKRVVTASVWVEPSGGVTCSVRRGAQGVDQREWLTSAT